MEQKKNSLVNVINMQIFRPIEKSTAPPKVV